MSGKKMDPRVREDDAKKIYRVEYIPQLDDITTSRIKVEGGRAHAPDTPGMGIEWDWGVIARRQIADIAIVQP